jgi:site-specific DNA-methyltransferase (adenine-specific)
VEQLQTKNLTLVNTDCLALLKTLDDNSIDLIATDPPYYKVVDADWDKQWTTETDFFQWLEQVMTELARVLKPNGSIYLFAGPHTATKVENAMTKHFTMLNHLYWAKPSGRWNLSRKEDLRRYFPQTEHILFAESKKKAPFAYEPIRSHLHQAIIDAGITQKQIDQACGIKMSGHWFGKSQWSMPPEKHYKTIKKLVGNKGKLKSYKQLYQEYRQLRDHSNQARRVFNVTKHVPHTNVWTYPSVQYYPGKHPCEKPLQMMIDIINASSLPGQVVLDCFVGGGSTAVACLKTDRTFIGSELGKEEYQGAKQRIERALNSV